MIITPRNVSYTVTDKDSNYEKNVFCVKGAFLGDVSRLYCRRSKDA